MNNPTSLHPIFWTITFLVALPLVLLAAALIAFLARHDEAAHSMLNVLRHTLLVEAACILVLAAWGAAYEHISASSDRRLYPPPGRLIDLELGLNYRGRRRQRHRGSVVNWLSKSELRVSSELPTRGPQLFLAACGVAKLMSPGTLAAELSTCDLSVNGMVVYS